MKEYKKIDYDSLKDKLSTLEKDAQAICFGLLNELIFMESTLNKLKNDVEDKGVVTEMCQGAYSINRTNPSLQSYNALIKNFTSTSKQLFEMMPKKESNEDNFDDDEL